MRTHSTHKHVVIGAPDEERAVIAFLAGATGGIPAMYDCKQLAEKTPDPKGQVLSVAAAVKMEHKEGAAVLFKNLDALDNTAVAYLLMAADSFKNLFQLEELYIGFLIDSAYLPDEGE